MYRGCWTRRDASGAAGGWARLHRHFWSQRLRIAAYASCLAGRIAVLRIHRIRHTQRAAIEILKPTKLGEAWMRGGDGPRATSGLKEEGGAVYFFCFEKSRRLDNKSERWSWSLSWVDRNRQCSGMPSHAFQLDGANKSAPHPISPCSPLGDRSLKKRASTPFSAITSHWRPADRLARSFSPQGSVAPSLSCCRYSAHVGIWSYMRTRPRWRI